MWIMATRGALMPSLRDPKTIPAGDDRFIQVRARRRSDLEWFRRLYCPELGPTVVNAGTDYEVRAYCTHVALGAAVARMVLDIDYRSFKSVSEDVHGDKKLHDAYVRVWWALYDGLSTRRAFSPRREARREMTTTVSRRGDAGTREWVRALLNGSLISEADDVARAVRDDDDDVETPARRSDGSINHRFCAHGEGRNARRRCLNRWRRLEGYRTGR